jgi:hypothetical protein
LYHAHTQPHFYALLRVPTLKQQHKMRKSPKTDRRVFQRRFEKDAAVTQEKQFPPLKQVELPIDMRKLGHGERTNKGLPRKDQHDQSGRRQPFPPEMARPYHSGGGRRRVPFDGAPPEGGESQQQQQQQQQQQHLAAVAFDTDMGEEEDVIGGDELPPPTDPTFGKPIDMEAFRQAVEEAGVKDFFQKVCSDILLQRPDDVFRFTARKFRTEARLMHSRRVAQEQKERQERELQLQNLAL